MQPGGALEPLPSCGAHVWGLTTTLKPPSRSPRSPRAKVLKPLMSLAAVGEPGMPRFFLPGLQTFEYISVIYMIIERQIIWNVFASGKSVYISFTPNVCFSSSWCLICNKNNLAFQDYTFYSCFWLTLKQCLGVRKCSGVIHRQCMIPYKTFWLHRMRSRGCVPGLCGKLTPAADAAIFSPAWELRIPICLCWKMMSSSSGGFHMYCSPFPINTASWKY